MTEMATTTSLAFLLLATAIVPLCVSEDVVVTTKNGALRGRRVSTGQTSYLDTFLGIPFAAPPVGSLRFKAPQPAVAWTGTRDATQFSKICPQLPYGVFVLGLPTSEDCLNLNVYSPKPSSDKQLLPVMVWIHGGTYRTGAGAYYNGTELASRDVVVVTINYRLDALGFLSTLDDACPGNNGLLDQILALKWVKDNIASFHGNPSDVTIFGESAGSGCVALLRLSPLAQGLFSKAIMESGVSLSAWAVARPEKGDVSPAVIARNLASAVGCHQAVAQSTAALVECLRTAPLDAILRSAETMFKSVGTPVFRPTVETVAGVVPGNPLALLIRGLTGSNITSIRGVNKDEFTIFILSSPLSYFTLDSVKAQIVQFAQTYFPDHGQSVANKIIAEYITSRHLTTPEQCRDAVIQIRTDFDFIAPTVLEQEHSVTRSGHAKQYLYEFTYRATHTNRPAWAGVTHASELPFVFGQPFVHDKFFAHDFPYSWSAQDKTVSSTMITLWTNFAKYGNPTPQSVGGVSWPPFSLNNQSYLDIGSSLSAKVDLAGERVRFWATILNEVGGLIG